MNNRVLLVDDDANILSAYCRNLRKQFDIVTAENGAEGLHVIKEKGPFAVVVSDFRMPGMDGIQFLTQARQIEPDTVRVMLTGQADMQMSIDAINEGNIFRFMTKPCSTEHLTNALKAAIEQYHLITSERELLNKTLNGSIKIMIDILSMVSPIAFSQSSRLRNITQMVAKQLGIQELWEIDLAAMLSQIGCVTIPSDILEKKYVGQSLTSKENEIYSSHYQTGKDLLANIPRLEGIAEAIAYQSKQYDGGGIPFDNIKGKAIPLEARILKAVIDFVIELQSGKSCNQSLKLLKSNSGWYDPEVIIALENVILSEEITDIDAGLVKKLIPLKEIMTGMVMAEDIKLTSGLVLVSKGYEISEVIKIRLTNFAYVNCIVEPITVYERLKK